MPLSVDQINLFSKFCGKVLTIVYRLFPPRMSSDFIPSKNLLSANDAFSQKFTLGGAIFLSLFATIKK